MKPIEWVVFPSVLAFVAYLFGPTAYSRFEPATWLYDVVGIDVSHHQGVIDWPLVAASDVQFAFIKATEGGDFVDPRFHDNWKGAKHAGVLRGAYHFFTQCRTGRQQAENVIRTVPVDPAALPPVIDAEHMGPCRKSPQISDVAAELLAMSNTLQAHYGKRPLIYTTREFHDRYLVGNLAGHVFWLRSLVVPPDFRPEAWMVWQYHNAGRRPGISGPVDLNVARFGLESLKNQPKTHDARP